MKISQLTLGTAQLGSGYGIANKEGKLKTQQAFDLLNEATQLGITYFDTASAYGDSEILLGQYFKKNVSQRPLKIITKIKALKFNDHVSTGQADETLEKEIAGSLNRLEVSQIPLVMFHHFEDLLWNNHYLLKKLTTGEYKSKVSQIGVSVYDPAEALHALQIAEVSAIQIPSNLLDMRFINVHFFEKAQQSKKEIYVRSLYLQGLLLMNAKDIPSELQELLIFREILEKIAGSLNMTLPQMTFAFLNHFKKDLHYVVGCETIPQLRENVDLCLRAAVLSKETVSQIINAVKDLPQWILDPRQWPLKYK